MPGANTDSREGSPYRQILQRVWGYPAFRPLQEEIIDCVSRGSDTLALLPTGGGKSLLYQVAGIARGGTTLVITPLIALMEDQVGALKKRGIRAHTIHSGLPFARIKSILEDLRNSQSGFLYLSPERLSTQMLLQYLPYLNVQLLAVDEAHCISQWGFDFRPSYRKIAKLRELLPLVPTIAVTATATPLVVDDIMQQLAFQGKGQLFRASFTRENLVYGVVQIPNARDRLLAFVQRMEGCGIVYARSRATTMQLAHMLRSMNISANYYHAGLSHRERQARQREWMEGSTRVMVATNAFGMGVDKPDVRFVAHYGFPPSLEEYYQEVGRAGRDGRKAYVALYFDQELYEGMLKRHSQKYPPRRLVEELWQMLLREFTVRCVETDETTEYRLDFQEADRICQIINHKRKTNLAHQALNVLIRQEYVELEEDADPAIRVQLTAPRSTVEEIMQRHQLYNATLWTLRGLYGGIAREPQIVNTDDVARKAGIEEYLIRCALTALEKLGVLNISWPSGQKRLILTSYGATRSTFDYDRYRADQARDHERLRAMLEYATSLEGCRESILRRYFGEKETAPCGHCDLCLEQRATLSTDEALECLRKLTAPDGARITMEDLYRALENSHHPEKVRSTLQILIHRGLLVVNRNGHIIPPRE